MNSRVTLPPQVLSRAGLKGISQPMDYAISTPGALNS